MAFAQHYRRLDEQGSRPSIQDAWSAYISGPPVAAIADEVRDFLAKAIDDSIGIRTADDELDAYIDEDANRGDR